MSETQVIDAGNTLIKVGHFKNGELVSNTVFKRGSDLSKSLQKELPSIISNTGTELNEAVMPNSVLYLDHSVPTPLVVEYSTPETLGPDRLANCSAAISIHPNLNLLVIDLGSCITYDLVSKEGIFLGGAISPGLSFRAKSMNNFSARLPLISIEGQPELLGKDTQSSLKSGAYNGMLSEIEGMIGRFSESINELNVVLTGGDLPHFEKEIKCPIFAHPNLTLIGLNEILLYNSR
jgi:type III pantothenate kinase